MGSLSHSFDPIRSLDHSLFSRLISYIGLISLFRFCPRDREVAPTTGFGRPVNLKCELRLSTQELRKQQ